MKILVDKAEFSDLLSKARKCSSNSSGGFPIYGYVLVVADGETVTVTTTDGEASYTGSVQATVEAAGTACLPLVSLCAKVRGILSGTVSISVTDKRAEVAGDKVNFKIPATSADEWPPPPTMVHSDAMTFASETLTRMASQVLPSIHPDPSRIGINGVYVEDKGDTAAFVSTDGHRLSWSSGLKEGGTGSTARSLIPARAIQAMRGVTEEARVIIGESGMKLESGTDSYWFRMLDGEFPDYRAVVPKSEVTMTADREGLLATLKSLAAIGKDRDRTTRLDIGTEATKLTKHAEGETGSASIDADSDTEYAVGVNGAYLADVLKLIANDTVTISGTGTSSAPLKVQGELEYFGIIMPRRID